MSEDGNSAEGAAEAARKLVEPAPRTFGEFLESVPPAQLVKVTHLWGSQRQSGSSSYKQLLGCVDGFDQDEAESKRDERAVILRRLLASKCDTLEAFELADSLFNACPCLVECFRKEGGHILGVGSIRDCRTYSALARGVAV